MIRNVANYAPYRTCAETAVGIQERNTKLALGIFECYVTMLAGQGRAARVFLEESRTRREASRATVERSFRAYAGPAYGPAPVETSAGGEVLQRLPADDYERLGVEELGRRLKGLRVRDGERLKTHERRTRNRRRVMERLDHSLV